MNDGATMLRERLEDAGYFAAYSQLGDGNFRSYDWEKMAPALPETTRMLWHFFLLGAKVPRADIRKLIGESALRFLRGHGLCRNHGRDISMGPLVLISHRELVFFAEQGRDPAGYFGEDTKALMTLLPCHGTGRCLVLYPGCGAAALPLVTKGGGHCDFAEGLFNKQLIEANLRLADSTGPGGFPEERIRRGKNPYDLILATVPSLVEPPGFRLSQVIAGGRDGRRELQRTLALARKRLAPEGQLLAVFIFFAENDSAKMRQRLEGFLGADGLDYSLTICSKHLMEIGVPIHNLILSAAASSGGDAAQAAARMQRHLKHLRYEAAYLIKGRFFRQRRPARHEIMDFSDLYYGGWTF